MPDGALVPLSSTHTRSTELGNVVRTGCSMTDMPCHCVAGQIASVVQSSIQCRSCEQYCPVGALQLFTGCKKPGYFTMLLIRHS